MATFTLIARELALYSALTKAFSGTPVNVLLGDVKNSAHRFDCIVSPGNSFGLMDGGIDAVYAEMWPGIQEAVQREIRHYYACEQPVGTCLIIPIPGIWDKFLAHAPTMRVPMGIENTDHVYMAMRAVLLAVRVRRNMDLRGALQARTIETVLCPGLGTGAGGMPPERAARHMRMAWDNVREYPAVVDWPYADRVHAQLGVPRP